MGGGGEGEASTTRHSLIHKEDEFMKKAEARPEDSEGNQCGFTGIKETELGQSRGPCSGQWKRGAEDTKMAEGRNGSEL